MVQKSKALGNMAALVGVQALNYLLPLITIPVIVRIIGPTKLGIINYLSAIVGYFILFIGFNFELSATRVIASNPDDHEEVNRTFNQVFYSKLLLFTISAIVFCLLLFLAPVFRNDSLIAIYTFLLSFATVFDCSFLYTAKQDLKQTALFNLITKVILNVSLLIFITKQEDYIYQPLIISVAQIVVAGGTFGWAIRRYHLTITYPIFKNVFGTIWKGRSLFLHSFAHTVYTTINIVILGLMRGVTEVGYYTAGFKLIILIQALLISPLGLVLFPIIGRAFGKSNRSGIVIIQKALPLILLSTLFIAVIILLFGNVFINAFYGSKFNNSVSIFRLLSFMPLLLALNMLLGTQTMVNLKMDKSFVRITVIASVVNVLSSFFFIRTWGGAGAAISWFLTEMACSVMMLFVLLKAKIKLYNSSYFNPQILASQGALLVSKIKSMLRNQTLNAAESSARVER